MLFVEILGSVPLLVRVICGHDPKRWRHQTWLTLLLVSCLLKGPWASVRQGRVQPHAVVRALYVLKDCKTRLSSGLKCLSIDTLLLYRCKKGLHRRIIVTIASATHTHGDPFLLETLLIAPARVLTAPV
jgi:hypothetical protein